MAVISGATRAFFVAAASAAAVMAAPASAATYNNFNPATGTGTYGNDAVSTSPFSDLFTFVVNKTSTLSSSILSSKSGRNDINFSLVQLTGPNGFSADYDKISEGVFEFRTYGPNIIQAGTYTLSVKGTSTGTASYTGDFTLAGVPEPATWGLMILGFGAVGGAMRRRQAVKARVAFA
jgi:hypothetical protein